MLKIGIAIITLNEEKNIKKALDSARFADEIIVIDSGSKDKTEEIVRNADIRFLYHKWEGYGAQKQFACDSLNVDIIFSLDADEYITEECKEELKELLKNGFDESGFRVPSYCTFMGKIIYHGKGPAYPIRIFKKGKGKFDLRPVHETLQLDGNVGQLKHGIIHNTAETISDKIIKIKRDAFLELKCKGFKKVGPKEFLYIPTKYFLYNLIKRKGYKDGIPGIIWLTLFSWQLFYQYWIYFLYSKKSV